jgi:photosystem II stability/assembly factor-like uncharacterized protein
MYMDNLKRRTYWWIIIGLLATFVGGCKPGGRPEFAMPEFKMITGENLHSVVAFSPQEVEVFGNHGVIYGTANGGAGLKDWEPRESGTKDLLLCQASFINREKGWVVGTRGSVIHTSDGGKTWINQESGTEKNLFSVSFVDDRNGWAVGEFGTIIHTSNGGESWESQSKGVDKELNSVRFVDARNGWVVGEFGTILHTKDGGETWEQQICEAIQTEEDMFSFDWKPMPALYALSCKDKDTAWIAGMDGIILKTSNGGSEWIKLESNCDVPLYSITVKGSRGWAVGSRGYYLLSLDGGETWEVRDGVIKTRFWLREVSFSDENNGWIVGAMGTVARSKDGGENWELISGMTYDMPEYGLADF